MTNVISASGSADYEQATSLQALSGIAAPAQTHDPLRPEASLVSQYLRVIRRRKWVILGSLLAGLLAGLLFNVLSTREFTAVSTVEIARADAQLIEMEGVREDVTYADQEFYETQYGLLRSRALAERVARDMRLVRDPGFAAATGLPTETTEGAAASRERLRLVREALLEVVQISPRLNSRLVDIAVVTPDPDLSARIANAWAEGFIKSNIDRGIDDTRFARDYLERELNEMRQRLEQSERAAVIYASRNGIFTVDTTDGEGERVSSQSLKEQNLASFGEELAKATTERVAAEALYRNRVATQADRESVAALRRTRAELAAERQKLLVQFEPGYPAARQLEAQIAQLDRAIADEERQASGSRSRELESSYRAAVDREEEMRRRLAQARDALVEERKLGIQYAIFQREADNNRQLYDALLQRYKQIGVAAGVGRTNVSLVDRADVPFRPSAPRLPLNLLIGSLLGVLAGFVLVIAREQIDVSLNDPSEVEKQLGLPLLGLVPNFGDGTAQTAMLEIRDRKSELSDAMLSLKTRISFTTTHGFPKTLSLTSPKPGEGKSTTSVALANTLALSGRKVLLVDFDMRKPTVGDFFGLDRQRGVSNALAGENDLGSLISRPENVSFDVMPAGPNPPNAAELLASDRLAEIFAMLGADYDHIICDSPPVIGLADALLLATAVEATLIVVRAHSTRVNEVLGALGRLRGVPAHIIGATLTHFDVKGADYGYGYGYSYGSNDEAVAR